MLKNSIVGLRMMCILIIVEAPTHVHWSNHLKLKLIFSSFNWFYSKKTATHDKYNLKLYRDTTFASIQSLAGYAFFSTHRCHVCPQHFYYTIIPLIYFQGIHAFGLSMSCPISNWKYTQPKKGIETKYFEFIVAVYQEQVTGICTD